MTYDSFGRMVREIDEVGVPTVYGYDARGNMTTRTATRSVAGGVETLVTTYEYDPRGLQTKTVYPDASETHVGKRKGCHPSFGS